MNDAVGLIGLGNAGSALVSAFSGQCKLVGYDANPARRDAVTGLDLQWVGSAAGVAGEAHMVLLSLPRPEASKAVVAELLASARPPQLIVETSTVTPNTARDLGAMCDGAGVDFIDAAVGSGVQAMA
ncbi:MAG: NAD(P)-binding domain-containing protein, partial [Alphaproteobacteria bacterium]|nr:NAD(P)-binding domain-containing protein [Alphaproteobacteria bacterium]